MNCFEWLTRSSDFLDGTLPSAKKQEADEHLDSCEECGERYRHYRLILTSIAEQPRISLPIAIRKSPLSSPLPRAELMTSRSTWERLPWYLRTFLEATGIVLLALGGVSVGPKLRSLYEQKIEKSLNDFSQAFSDAPSSATSPDSGSAPITANSDPTPGDDFSDEGEESSSNGEQATSDNSDNQESSADPEDIKVGKSDIWRFILRTDSPQEVRPKISALLKTLLPAEAAKNSRSSSQIQGINAPGGIQFDLLLPQSSVARLKHQLSELAPPPPDGTADTPVGETFTWYKIKSKRSIPAGKTRVVIWISQI